MKTPCLILLGVILVLAGCATTQLPPDAAEQRSASLYLAEAQRKNLSAESRAIAYLNAAREAIRLLDSPAAGEDARKIYNQSAAELTVLLRDAENGRMWAHPQTLNSGGNNYHLRFAKETRDGVWSPAHFTSFAQAETVDLKTIQRRNRVDGIGGALVGVRKAEPLEAFSPMIGVTAPVTAVLDFKGNEVMLSLIDPSEKAKACVSGSERKLDADFSAPLAYYPQKSEYWEGIMGALRVTDYMKTTGLYMLQPYDPDRIPLIFVHGLISTPRMWRNVINELETDPELRRRYQCWVFAYPTGNPPLYSALRLREELAKLQQIHPRSRDMVLVGHSMGGILSRTQVTTVRREDWNAIGKERASRVFAKVKPGDLVDRATTFNSNPHVERAIFICTPHRGSEMALGSLGELAIRLISLPADLTSTLTATLGDSMAVITGDPKHMPNSVAGLSPNNPAFTVLNKLPITVLHHSIIGDRGKGDTPNSSDGVVDYGSSHLEGAQSEKLVPGPHGACELPETIDELRRILLLHLKSN